MAEVDVGARDAPPVNDDLDDIFNNYEVDPALFQDVDTNMDVAPKQPATHKPKDDVFDGGLGLDEEVKVTKKRAPIAKLDEARLLSQAGIPKLRRSAKEKLRFKGKGHEYSDVTRLLTFYQLWLDDLYPRAKFGDGLAMIEKLGHSKRMQVMRKEWINEGKAKDTRLEDAEKARPSAAVPERLKQPVSGSSSDHRGQSSEVYGSKEQSPTLVAGSGGSKDKQKGLEVSADDSLFLSDDEDIAETATGNGTRDKAKDDPLEDDLDALLAEEEARDDPTELVRQQASLSVPKQDDFNDEEEAMADMDGFW